MVITRSLHRSNKKRLRIKKATTFLVFVIIVQNDLANIFYTQICSVYPTNTLLLGILFEIIYRLKRPDYTLIYCIVIYVFTNTYLILSFFFK